MLNIILWKLRILIIDILVTLYPSTTQKGR